MFPLTNPQSVSIAHNVPAPEIKKICILHNKTYTGYDYSDQ